MKNIITVVCFYAMLIGICFSQTKNNELLKKLKISVIKTTSTCNSTTSRASDVIEYINDSGLVYKSVITSKSLDTTNRIIAECTEYYQYDLLNRMIFESRIFNGKQSKTVYKWMPKHSYLCSYSSEDTSYTTKGKQTSKITASKQIYKTYRNNKLLTETTYTKQGTNWLFKSISQYYKRCFGQNCIEDKKRTYSISNGIEYRDTLDNIIKFEYTTTFFKDKKETLKVHSINTYEYDSNKLLIKKTEENLGEITTYYYSYE